MFTSLMVSDVCMLLCTIRVHLHYCVESLLTVLVFMNVASHDIVIEVCLLLFTFTIMWRRH
jgi:hypothetical protein